MRPGQETAVFPFFAFCVGRSFFFGKNTGNERNLAMESFNEAWEPICDYCRAHITDVAFQTWFSRLKPASIDFSHGIATIEVPNEFHKNTLTRCYSDLLNDTFRSVFGDEINYRLCVHDEIEMEESLPANNETDDEFSFENFITGQSNKFAQAAAQAVANNPANAYNPLFIYGNSGLGKTHLLFAIKNRILQNNPRAIIQYVKGDEFTNEMIEAIAQNTTSQFRQKYRYADVLLVDDIHFIAGKDATQEEFFHTFNTLYQSKKQIVLTSDRPPKDIATLEERLKTRFEWGLTADIVPPDFETRIAIIRHKAKSLDIHIPDAVCEYIANRLKNNVRQLEGTVKKLKAYSLLEKKEPSVAIAQAAISDIINNDQPTSVTVDKIVEEVARTYGVSIDDIRSQKRNANVSTARQVAVYVVREITQLPLAEIGKSFGGRDHSTIVYAIQQVEKAFKKDKSVKDKVNDIIKNIRDR